MTRQDVLQRLCSLCHAVNAKHFEFNTPSDCFCEHRPHSDINFQFSEKIIEFIESAVNEKLERS